MARSAILPMTADRYAPIVRLIRLRGIALADAGGMQMQVRRGIEWPGSPLVNLLGVTTLAQGIRRVSGTVEDGVPVTTLAIQIDEATVTGLPFAAVRGEPMRLAYDFHAVIGGYKRVLFGGPMVLEGGVIGADSAPGNRAPGLDEQRSDGWSTATLTFSDDLVEITLDGVDLLGPLAASAEAARAAAIEARDDAVAAAAALPATIETIGRTMNRLIFLRPTKTKPFTAMKITERRWWVLTFIPGGSRQDYAIHEFYNQGPSQAPAISNCWKYNGCVAYMDGLFEELANLSGEDIGGGVFDSLQPSTWEPVIRIGAAAGPKDFVGVGHGHLLEPTSSIMVGGDATNYRDPANAPIGTVIRGASQTFDQTFQVQLPGSSAIVGTLSLSHLMVPGGVNIAGSFTFAPGDVVATTAYGAMLNGMGNRLKAAGIAAIAADQEDGLEYGAGGALNGNLGERSTYALYNDSRPKHLMEAVLNYGSPLDIDGVRDWSANESNRDSWLQARAEGYAKVYVAGINSSASIPIGGKTIGFNVTYRARIGDAAP